jgi:hypothetical protein
MDLSTIEGARLVGADGQFLGLISRDPAAPDSLANVAGRFGSLISPTSIFNVVGPYGARFSPLSPSSAAASDPPRIVDGRGAFVAYLTANPLKSPRVRPEALGAFLGR